MQTNNHNVTIPMADYQKMMEAIKENELLIKNLKTHYELMAEVGINFGNMNITSIPKNIRNIGSPGKIIIDFIY